MLPLKCLNSIIAYCSFVTRLKKFLLLSRFSSFALLSLHYSIFKIPSLRFRRAIYFKHFRALKSVAQCGSAHLSLQVLFPLHYACLFMQLLSLLGGHNVDKSTCHYKCSSLFIMLAFLCSFFCCLVGTMWTSPLVITSALPSSLCLPFYAASFAAWWAQVDSNHRPHAYQACALTT